MLCVWGLGTTYGQGSFAPPAGQPGSTAIHKDALVFTSWATSAEVNRGYQVIGDPSSGYPTFGNALSPLGRPGENGVVSLGDGGTLTLFFADGIRDGTGPDFAVFENSFSDHFLELGFVEVSSDGRNFTRFPAITEVDTHQQLDAFGLMDATQLYNFAGKYRSGYGVPFDLHELAGTPGLNVQHITHVRVVDVVGSLDPLFASYDAHGNKVNDPFPTPFPSGGVDVDAVGVIHRSPLGVPSVSKPVIQLSPNPFRQTVKVSWGPDSEFRKMTIYSTTGMRLKQYTVSGHQSEMRLDLQALPAGLYLIELLGPHRRAVALLTRQE